MSMRHSSFLALLIVCEVTNFILNFQIFGIVIMNRLARMMLLREIMEKTTITILREPLMLALINMVFSGAKDSVCNKKTHGFHLFAKTSPNFH